MKSKTYARKTKATGRPKRKLKLQEESDIEFDDLSQFKVAPSKKSRNLGELLKTLEKYGAYSVMKQLKFDTRTDE